MEKQIVLFDSDEAAHYRTNLAGWVSGNGHYWGDDERAARYDGCTHRACEDCEKPTEKGWLVCKECRENRDKARYEALPEEIWNEVGMLYSNYAEKYFSSWDEVEEYCDEEELEESVLRLVVCDEQYLPLLNDDYGCDSLAEDGKLPDSVIEAIDKFNEVIKNAGPVSWYPGKKRAIRQ